MTLFISDIHFGRGSPQENRKTEDDLIACLQTVRPTIEALYLLGDIFDYYIEYRHLIPKGFVRFQALLAEWTRAGIPVIYLVGNHDPWHEDYFEQELGVTVHHKEFIEEIDTQTCYLAHGDGLGTSNPIYRRIKPLLRNPVLVNLYRTILPGSTGVRLARWYSQTFAAEEADPKLIAGLRQHARQVLQSTRADTVIMGHTHHPVIQQWPEGQYINTGSWYMDRSIAVLEAGELFLKKWNGNQTLLVEQEPPVTEKSTS